MPPTHPTPGAAPVDPDERSRRIDATVRRLRTGSYAEARDLVERLDDVADRSFAVFEQIGETHGAATRAERAAERSEAHAERSASAAVEARNEARAVRVELRALRRGEELPQLVPIAAQPRPHAPSFSEYDPEITANGTVKFPQEQFAALQAKFAEQQHRADIAEAEKRGSEKAKAEAEAAKTKSDNDRERMQRRLAFYLSVVAAAAAGGAWLLTHVFHL